MRVFGRCHRSKLRSLPRQLGFGASNLEVWKPSKIDIDFDLGRERDSNDDSGMEETLFLQRGMLPMFLLRRRFGWNHRLAQCHAFTNYARI